MKRSNDWQTRQLERLAISFLISGLLALRAAGVWAAEPPKPIQISLPASYEVADPSATILTIGDLTESIDGASEKELETLRAIPTMDVPQPGKSLICSKSRLLAAARMAGFKDYGRLRFEGTQSFQVYGLGQTVTKEQIIEKIIQDITEDLEWDPEELSVRVLSFPEVVRLPPGEARLEAYRTSPHRYGSVRYDLTLLIDGEEYLHRGVIVTIAHRRDVFVFRRSKEAGSILTPDDVETQTRYIRSEREDEYTISDAGELIGRKLGRSAARGIPVTRNLFSRTYLLSRGNIVSVVVRSGALRMDVRGRAMQNGNVGDIIRVKNLFNNKVVTGRVVNKDTVEIL